MEAADPENDGAGARTSAVCRWAARAEGGIRRPVRCEARAAAAVWAFLPVAPVIDTRGR